VHFNLLLGANVSLWSGISWRLRNTEIVHQSNLWLLVLILLVVIILIHNIDVFVGALFVNLSNMLFSILQEPSPNILFVSIRTTLLNCSSNVWIGYENVLQKELLA